MGEPKVGFVEAEGFTINLPTPGAPVAVRAEGDEVVISVRLTMRPTDNVVDIDLDVSADGDSTAMPRLHQDAPAKIGWNCRAFSHFAAPELHYF